MKEFLNIFLDPSPVFRREQETLRWWLPFAVLVAATMVVTFLYFDKVDTGWFLEQRILSSGREVSEQQLAAIRERTSGGGFMLWSATLGSGLSLGVVLLLFSGFFALVGKFSGTAVSFKQALTLASWAHVPTLIHSLLMLIAVLGMSPQTSLESLSLTSVNALFLDLQPDDRWFRLASSVSVLVPWTIFLTALGWKQWTRATGWLTPIVVATVPHLVIYGGMAIGAMSG